MPDDRESEMALSDDGLYLFVRECVARLIGCVDWGHGGGRRFGQTGGRDLCSGDFGGWLWLN